MFTLLGDLKFGMRMLLATPRVTITAVLSLALGIGATTAIFTVVDAVLLRPLPFAEPDRLAAVWETAPDADRRSVAPANFLDWRKEARSFVQLAAYDTYGVNLTGGDRPERLRAASASGNIFATLGVGAAVGRMFTDAEDAAGAAPMAMLSYGAWQRMFAGNAQALGRTLTIDGRPHVLVGVLPPSFSFFGPDVEIVTSGDRGIPNSFPMPTDLTQVRDAHVIAVVGRLRPGVSIDQAQAEMTTIMRRLEREYPATNSRLSARIIPLQQDVVAESRTALLLLLGAVAFLLLIACVNVANLLLARSVARQREMSIRVSLGAGRARLIRQVLTETMLLGILGGCGGLLLATWGVQALVALAPEGLPRASEIHVDVTTMLVASLLSIGTALIFGLAPAWQAARGPAQQAARTDSTRTSETRSQRRLQRTLVVAELTLAQVLLSGAALLIASFLRVQNVELGFSPDRLLAVELTTPVGKYKDPERKLAFNRAVLEKLESLPGVRSAAATLTVPLRGAINRGIWLLDRPEPPPGQHSSVDFMIVSPGYFQTLGIPVVTGRHFNEQDSFSSPRVAMISDAMARRYWPNGNAIGQRVRFGGSKVAEVVGIVGDVRQRDPARAPEPLLYIPLQQDSEPWNFIAFALRTQGEPGALASAVREAVLAVDPDQPVARIRTIGEIADGLVAARRFNTILLSVFSGVALLLAAIGTYGVMAYSVTRRTREIGVRMALGARPADVLRMVLGQGSGLVAFAIGLGLSGALATNRLLGSQLFEVTAADPVMLAAGAATLCTFALIACYVPARRAMRIEPLLALREE